MRSLHRRIRAEAAAAVASGALCVLTLVTRGWIEVVFGIDPDRGQGWLEWFVVAMCAVVAIAAAVAARRDVLRLRIAADGSGPLAAHGG